MPDYSEIYSGLNLLWNDSAVTSWSFYPEFRREWENLLKKALVSDTEYFPVRSASVISVPCSFGGMDFEFHMDQLKMADWYQKESAKGKKIVFVPKKFKIESPGLMNFKDAVCRYDTSLKEPALTEDIRNVFACAVPGLPAGMRVVYGNKWVESQLNAFRRRSVYLSWIQTDYVPAFLPNPFEVCLYLFLMDYCILKENYSKVKDGDMKAFLHIFRPSPMLVIKKLLKN